MCTSIFFIVFTLFFMIELVMLSFFQQPTIPFVCIIALCALMQNVFPWYLYGYMALGISLITFIQGFAITPNLVVFGCLALASLWVRDVLIHNIAAQTVLILMGTLLFVSINCIACITLVNSFLAVLFVPSMLYLLK